MTSGNFRHSGSYNSKELAHYTKEWTIDERSKPDERKQASVEVIASIAAFHAQVQNVSSKSFKECSKPYTPHGLNWEIKHGKRAVAMMAVDPTPTSSGLDVYYVVGTRQYDCKSQSLTLALAGMEILLHSRRVSGL